jgi:hypothetical protein
MRHLANEPSRDHAEAYFFACTGQIRNLSVVSAMNPARSRPAQWALGHTAIGSNGQNIESDESLTLSITKPLGTSDEIRMPARMVLIPPVGEPQARQKKSSDVSQTPTVTPGRW